MKEKAYWKVHTPNLLKEILLNNPGAHILSIPINIFGKLLFQVGECACRINDIELNKLMIKLTIYSQADPESPDYNKELCDKILNMEVKS